MTQPMQDPNQMLPQQGPVTGDMIMALRREAMQKQGMQTDQSGAINRRLQGQGQVPGVNNNPIDANSQGQQQDNNNPLLQGQTPTQIQLSDIQAQQDSVPPPDIQQSAAEMMMKYGAVFQFLQEAKGQIQQQ